jgi:hypothetical protein
MHSWRTFLTTDELIEIYDKASRGGFVQNGTWLDTHTVGLEAVAEATAQVWRDYFYGPGVEDLPVVLNPRMIGRLVTITWLQEGVGEVSAVGRLAAYSVTKDYPSRVWFENTDPEGYLMQTEFTVTVHGGTQ